MATNRAMALQCGSGLAAAVHVQRCASWPLAEIVTAHRTDLLVTEFASLDEAEEAWGKLSLLHASVLFVGPKALRSYGRTHSIRRWKERSARLEARRDAESKLQESKVLVRKAEDLRVEAERSAEASSRRCAELEQQLQRERWERDDDNRRGSQRVSELEERLSASKHAFERLHKLAPTRPAPCALPTPDGVELSQVLGTWTHVVATVHGTSMKLYQDATLVSSADDGQEPTSMTRAKFLPASVVMRRFQLQFFSFSYVFSTTSCSFEYLLLYSCACATVSFPAAVSSSSAENAGEFEMSETVSYTHLTLPTKA